MADGISVADESYMDGKDLKALTAVIEKKKELAKRGLTVTPGNKFDLVARLEGQSFLERMRKTGVNYTLWPYTVSLTANSEELNDDGDEQAENRATGSPVFLPYRESCMTEDSLD